jgi:putative component of toxin-antitoxin plasmid stabilization module
VIEDRRWLEGIGDLQARARILVRIRRLYFARRGESRVLLLTGGDKGTQSEDIRQALDLARTL